MSRRQPHNDEGTALVLALVLLTAVAVVVGAILGFGFTAEQTTLSARSVLTATYAADGALDGAIASYSQNTSLGVDPQTGSLPSATCFTLPGAGSTTLTVKCQPRSGSGVVTGSTTTQPAQAIWAASTAAGGGVLRAAAGTVAVSGDVISKSQVVTSAGTNMSVTGSVKAAGACPGPAGTITATGSVTCSYAGGLTLAGSYALQTGSTLAELTVPGYTTATCPPVITLGSATTSSMYVDAGVLSTLMNSTCPGSVYWFQPGAYYFGFTDTGSHEWLINNASLDVVGGTPSGWDPTSATRPVVAYPSATAPTASGCNTAALGVQFIFGGDSRMNVQAGRVQLCATATGSGQQIALAGNNGNTATFSKPAVAVSGAVDLSPNGGTKWSPGAAGNGSWPQVMTKDAGPTGCTTTTCVSASNSNSGKQSDLQFTMAAAGLPAGAVVTGMQFSVYTTENKSGRSCLFLGSATIPASDPCVDPAAILIRTCPDPVTGAPCSGQYFSDVVSVPSNKLPTATAANAGQIVKFVASNYNNQPYDVSLDTITMAITYTAPMTPTDAGTATVYTRTPSGGQTSYALLKTGGAGSTSPTNTGVVVHGTIYAPAGALDLGTTGVGYVVVDRGVIVRDLYLAMTPSAGYAGPLISIPPILNNPRDVMLDVYSGSTLLAHAEVFFAQSYAANPGGDQNGTTPKVVQWVLH